jgi:hypothetical protein
MAGSRKGFRYPPYELILVVGESPHKTVDGELRGSFKPIRVYDARLAPSWRMVGSPSELVVKTLDQFFDVLGPLPTNTPLTSSRSGRSIVNPETLFAMADWAKEHEPVPDGLLLFRNNIGIGSEQLKAMAERVEAWTKLHPDQDFSLS